MKKLKYLILVFCLCAISCLDESDENIPNTFIDYQKQNITVIFKMDDLCTDRNDRITWNWTRFASLILQEDAAASMGIIGKYLENPHQTFINWVKEMVQSGNFEIFNHGYYHNILDYDGDTTNTEFKDREEILQRESIRKTQNLAKEKLGLTLKAFGAPNNAIEGTTATVLSEFSEIEIWFYGLNDNNAGKEILKRTKEIEYPTLYPNSEKFMQAFESIADNSQLVLQGHPDAWTKEEFVEFKIILKFLKANHVTFLLPSETL